MKIFLTSLLRNNKLTKIGEMPCGAQQCIAVASVSILRRLARGNRRFGRLFEAAILAFIQSEHTARQNIRGG